MKILANGYAVFLLISHLTPQLRLFMYNKIHNLLEQKTNISEELRNELGKS